MRHEPWGQETCESCGSTSCQTSWRPLSFLRPWSLGRSFWWNLPSASWVTACRRLSLLGEACSAAWAGSTCTRRPGWSSGLGSPSAPRSSALTCWATPCGISWTRGFEERAAAGSKREPEQVNGSTIMAQSQVGRSALGALLLLLVVTQASLACGFGVAGGERAGAGLGGPEAAKAASDQPPKVSIRNQAKWEIRAELQQQKGGGEA